MKKRIIKKVLLILETIFIFITAFFTMLTLILGYFLENIYYNSSLGISLFLFFISVIITIKNANYAYDDENLPRN